MSRPTLDNRSARRLFLQRHLLLERPAGAATGTGLLDLITQLGFVQVDSVNTMARAHDLILWSRRPAYRPQSLRWLNDRMRGTFEHWTHDASKIPVAFFPYWRMRFERDRARLKQKWEEWRGPEFHGELDRVMAHIGDNGAVCSAEMAGDHPGQSGGWWEWHPSKTALEYLWRVGELSVTRRAGFRKFYDLTERVIPPEHLNAHVDDAAIVDWACTAALDRLGFATSGELAAFFALIPPNAAKVWAADALAAGRVVEVEITCVDGSPRRSLCWPETLTGIADLPEPAKRLRILSPFDPALRDRKRAERLFGFHYRIEIFVPEPQRRFGYYVFPMMEGDRMVGRIDVQADRQADILAVRAVWPEPGVRWGTARQAKLEAELERVARLACVERVTFAENWLRGPSNTV